MQDGRFWWDLRALATPSWITREMETGSKERDGGGERTLLSYERGERFCMIINHIVSTCTGNVVWMICFTLSNSNLHVYIHVAICYEKCLSHIIENSRMRNHLAVTPLCRNFPERSIHYVLYPE